MVLLSGVILAAGIIVLGLAVFNGLRHRSRELFIWLPGITLIVISFLLDLLAEIELKSEAARTAEHLPGDYLIGAVALTYAVLSSFLLARIDPNKKIYPYYAFSTIFLGLFTLFTIQFGGTVNKVLTMPLFYFIGIVAVGVIFIYLFKEKVTGLMRLLGNLGWVIILVGYWLQFTLDGSALFAKIIVLLGLAAIGAYIYSYKRPENV